ncbi:MAG: TPM domain-containing protein [Caulobacter sp.]|nr:TPM domain-containing protein [Caulobacter sp.]
MTSHARSWWAPTFAGALGAIVLLTIALPALAAPTFPKLSGRVVDEANLLSPATETALTQKLEALETATGRQLVVATLPSLQGLEIEEYGYQLGRAWKLGGEKTDDGVVLIVAPNERKVRIEVGYGLEPVLTDALSSVIIQSTILPKFKAGDMEGGVVAGADALLQQLSLPDEAAKAQVAAAAEQPRAEGPPRWILALLAFGFVFMLINMMRAGRGGRRAMRGRDGRRRRRDDDDDNLTPLIIGGILGHMLGGGGGGGGGWSGGGGGFSGGGGSFGGGGASGGW